MWFKKDDAVFNLDQVESVSLSGANIFINAGAGTTMQSRTLTYASSSDASDAFAALLSALEQGNVCAP